MHRMHVDITFLNAYSSVRWFLFEESMETFSKIARTDSAFKHSIELFQAAVQI